MYRLLGLDAPLPRSRYRASHDALLHVVMARIVKPDSKRGSVRRLEEDFGVSLSLEKVYRMMDQLDATVIERLRTQVGEARRSRSSSSIAPRSTSRPRLRTSFASTASARTASTRTRRSCWP